MKKLILLLLCCLMLTACAQPSTTTEPQGTEPPTSPPTETDPVPTDTQPKTEAEPTVTGTPRLQVFSIDENLENFVSVWVDVDEITESVVLEQLIGAGVLAEDVQVLSLTQDGTALTVDFNAPFGDLINAQGTAGERAIMGSVVNTFLSAYGAETMTITVNGQVLESGHVVYDYPMEFFD